MPTPGEAVVNNPGMAAPTRTTPRQRSEEECARRGTAAFVTGCVALLEGNVDDSGLIVALGGPAAVGVLDGREGGRIGYWPRVWAARGLLHVWDDRATEAILRATEDPSWRVREMTANVVAGHGLDDALDAMIGLRTDPVPRVRLAAQRAIERLTSAGTRS